MRTPSALHAAAILAVALIPHPTSAQQITDVLRVSQEGSQFNARALGMGNAYAAVGYDCSALLFNPATMAVNKKFTWSVTANSDAFQSHSDYYGNRVDFTTTHMNGGQTGITFPVRLDSTRSIIVGMSYTQSKDFNVGYKFGGLNDGSQVPSFIRILTDQDDAVARALGVSYPTYDATDNYLGDETLLGAGMHETGFLLGQGGLTHYTLGAALEPVHNMFIGASGSYITGNYTTDLELSADDVNDVYPGGVATVPGDSLTEGFLGVDYRAVRDKQYRGWDMRVGVLYRLHDLLGLSASFELPSAHEVTEEAFLSGMSRFSGNTSRVVSDARAASTYHFKPPAKMTFGAMAHLAIVTGTVQATYVDYTSMQLTSGGGALPNRTLINKRIKEELTDVIDWNLGAEVRLPFTGLFGRAGAIYQPTPFKADPTLYAQKAFTLGAGYDANSVVQVDLGYAYAWRGENKELQIGAVDSGEQKAGRHTVLFTMRVTL